MQNTRSKAERFGMNPSVLETISDSVRKRHEANDEKFLFGAERVDVKYLGGLRFKVKKKDFEFYVDEPTERGGANTGVNPLAYFLSGCATCLGMQYLRLSVVHDLPFDSFDITAVGHYDRRIKGSFNEIIYDVRMEINNNGEQNKADTSKIVDLARQAEELCYAHNTLIRAGVKMKTNLFFNGKVIETMQSV